MSNNLRNRDYMILYGLGLIVSLALTVFQRVPGYMDAEYYYSGGLRLVDGHGFSEMILWNYLDDPVDLPHASHAYWMPLPSILAAGGMSLFQSRSYFAARTLFLLLAALVPPLTAFLAGRLGQDRRGAILAGFFGLFSGFYVIYTTLTEGFVIVMLAGSVFFLSVFGLKQSDGGTQNHMAYLIPGAAAGLLYLTRADGILWLAAGIMVIIWKGGKNNGDGSKQISAALIYLLTGFLAVTSGWFARNLLAFGSLSPSGGSRTLWLQNYDQTFVYPANFLTMQNWLTSGWQAIVGDRLAATMTNLKTALAVQVQVFLLPLVLAGLWKLRRDRRVVLGMSMWLAIFLAMSLAFPYAGARGGFLHSAAAIQPLLWAVVPSGLQVFVDWGRRGRNWNSRQAFSVLGVGLVVLSLMLSAFLYYQRVIGDDPTLPVWEKSWRENLAVEEALVGWGAQVDDVVMINNPAGMFAATGRPAIVIPYGPLETSLQVAQQYDAGWLVLEKNHVSGLQELYDLPGHRPGLEYLASEGSTHYFRFKGEK